MTSSSALFGGDHVLLYRDGVIDVTKRFVLGFISIPWGEIAPSITQRKSIHGRHFCLSAAFAKLLHTDDQHGDRHTQDQSFDQTSLTAREGEDDDGKTEDAGADICPRRPGRLIALVVVHGRQCT